MDALKKAKFITVKPALKVPKIIQPDYKPKVQTDAQGVVKPICKLNWTLTPETAIAKKEKVKFVLTGKNDTDAPISLSYIWIRFTSGAQGPQLFTNEVINGVKSPYYMAPEPPAPKLKPIPDSSSTKQVDPKPDVNILRSWPYCNAVNILLEIPTA